jgi:hypothetical protein
LERSRSGWWAEVSGDEAADLAGPRLSHGRSHSVKNACLGLRERAVDVPARRRFVATASELASQLAAVDSAATAETDFEAARSLFHQDHGDLRPCDLQ